MKIQDKMQKLAGDLRELLVDGKTFDGEIVGKGLTWTDGSSPLKQFFFTVNPNRFHSTENLELGKDQSYYINGDVVLSSTSLGEKVTRSNLTELGTLEGLIVNGQVNLANTVYVADGNVVVSATTQLDNISIGQGQVLTEGNLVLSSDNNVSIVLEQSGTISIGDKSKAPIQATVHGKLSVNVSNPDPEVDLQVAGAIKYEGRVHRYNIAPPVSGFHNVGDIIWNSQPRLEHYVGWVCIVAGNPGRWEPFGKIGNQ